MVDAQTMAAILYDFATHAELREAVRTEFTRIQGFFVDYQKALQKAIQSPKCPNPSRLRQR